MIGLECDYCKRYVMQGGTCYENKQNCLMFDREPRGRVKRTKVIVPFDFDGKYGTIKYHGKVTLVDGNQEFEVTVIKILEVDIDNAEIHMEVDYHENDWEPKTERVKKFRVIK